MDSGHAVGSEQVRAKGYACELMVGGGVLVIRRQVILDGVPAETESIPVQRITSIRTKAASSVSRGTVWFNLIDGRSIAVEFKRRQRHDVEQVIGAVNRAAAAAPNPASGVLTDPQVSAGRAPEQSPPQQQAGA